MRRGVQSERNGTGGGPGGTLDPGRSLPAERLFRAGRFAELAALAPSFPEVQLWQAGGLARQGRFDEAVAALRGLRRQWPDFQPARVALGRLQLFLALRRAEQEDWPAAAAALAAARATGSGFETASAAAALIFLRAGRRGEAIEALEEARQCDPNDGTLAHALFLACYHTARALGPRGLRGAGGVGVWERAIASWAALLRDDGFWEGWRARARQRAQWEPSAATIAELRRLLAASVGEVLDRGLEETPEPKRLQTLLRRELRGAELLDALGGLPLPGRQGAGMRCGPLTVRFLKLERAFGDFVASLAGRRRGLDDGQIRALRICFSSLGGVQALLDLDRPREALAALRDLACALCARPRAEDEIPVVCAQTCASFDALNPAYTGWPDKASRLAADAVTLAIEAHLAMARSAITATPLDCDAATASWQAALRLSIPHGREEEICRQITALAKGRIEALEIPARVGEAVALLEAAEAVCGGRGDADLVGRLAELLAVRGIAAANEVVSRWEDAVNDLRRAVETNAYSPHAVLNLGIALRQWAANQDETGYATKLLKEAEGVLQSGVQRFPERHDVAEELRKVKEDLAELWS